MTKEKRTAKREHNHLVFYGTEEVAAALKCSVPTARDIMHRPDFPLIQVGKNMRVSKTAFENWAMERRT